MKLGQIALNTLSMASTDRCCAANENPAIARRTLYITPGNKMTVGAVIASEGSRYGGEIKGREGRVWKPVSCMDAGHLIARAVRE